MSEPASGRLIDPRGHRFGAATSVLILAAAYLLNQPLVVALIALALGISAAFGTRYSVLGRPWPLVRRALRLGPPAELEAEFPPRFAQALGSIGLGFALLAFLIGIPLLGWLVTGAIVTLQAILALTGYCLGCRLYFLRWWLPAAFQRLVSAQRS
ncbi:hypothetical protein BH24CHL6_BH24CHL6_06190 [soil metagenome]